MSFQFRRIYPNDDKVFFDGGLNSKFERALLLDNESPDCMNVIFDNGAVETRSGTSYANTAAIGSYAIDGLYTRHDNTGAETMVAFSKGSMWYLGTTTFITIASSQSLYTTGVRVGASESEGYIFVGNGYVGPYKYNGTEFTQHGIYAPTATATAASQSTGGLTGDYRYVYTNVNSASVEGDVSPVMGTFTATNALIRVTIATATVSYGVNARKIYRTVAGGSTYKLVTTISDNTTTTYDDNIADGSLGATAPTDQGMPPKYSIIKYHGALRRHFMNDISNLNYVWYTEADNPYVVKTTSFLRLGDDTGDTVKALETYENVLVVFCSRFNYIVYFPDNDTTNWLVTKTKSIYGTNSPFAVVPYKNRLLFAANEGGKFVGFANYEGNSLAVNTTFLTVANIGSELVSDPIEPDMDNVQDTYAGNISAIAFKNKIYIALTYGDGNTTNNRIYVLDFSLGNVSKKQVTAWTRWSGLNISQFTIYNNTLYGGSSTGNGYVYKLMASTYNDVGSAIDSYYWTKEFTGFKNEANYFKDFRYTNFLVDMAGDYFMDVAYRLDSEVGGGTNQQVNLNPGGSLWGTAIFGTDTWGGGVVQKEIKLYLNNARGKRLQLQFSNQNTADQRFKVHYMTYTYLKKGLR